MRKQVELLENHARFLPDDIYILSTCRQIVAVYNDAAFLNGLQLIDTTDEGRLPRARRTANNNAFTASDIQINISESMISAVPLVYSLHEHCRI